MVVDGKPKGNDGLVFEGSLNMEQNQRQTCLSIPDN